MHVHPVKLAGAHRELREGSAGERRPPVGGRGREKRRRRGPKGQRAKHVGGVHQRHGNANEDDEQRGRKGRRCARRCACYAAYAAAGLGVLRMLGAIARCCVACTRGKPCPTRMCLFTLSTRLNVAARTGRQHVARGSTRPSWHSPHRCVTKAASAQSPWVFASGRLATPTQTDITRGESLSSPSHQACHAGTAHSPVCRLLGSHPDQKRQHAQRAQHAAAYPRQTQT